MWGSDIVRRRQFYPIPVSFCLVVLLFVGAGAGHKIIPIQGIQPVQNPHNADQVRRSISDVSQKNLLGLDRPNPLAMPTARQGIPIEDVGASVMVDTTIKILAIRVEFLRESPDNPRTTGDGTFDMRSYNQFVAEEGHFIDPAPHDKAYFNSHLTAVRGVGHHAGSRLGYISERGQRRLSASGAYVLLRRGGRFGMDRSAGSTRAFLYRRHNPRRHLRSLDRFFII